MLEEVFNILFEDGDERFVFEVLKKVKGVERYMYQVNERGWFPLFRVLHLFQKQLYESEKIKK